MNTVFITKVEIDAQVDRTKIVLSNGDVLEGAEKISISEFGANGIPVLNLRIAMIDPNDHDVLR